MRQTVSSFLRSRPGRHRYGGQDIPQEGTRTRAMYDRLTTGEWVSFEDYERAAVRHTMTYLRVIYGFEIETMVDKHEWGSRAKYRLIE